jgi:hypothetical protein
MRHLRIVMVQPLGGKLDECCTQGLAKERALVPVATGWGQLGLPGSPATMMCGG